MLLRCHVLCLLLSLYECSLHPSLALPSPDEDESADVFVESEGYPHADKSETEYESEQPAKEDSDYPHDGDADIEREVDIANAPENIGIEDVADFSYLQHYVHNEDGAAKRDDLLIAGEELKDRSSGKGTQDAQTDSGDDSNSQGVPTELVGCMVTMIADKMTDDY